MSGHDAPLATRFPVPDGAPLGRIGVYRKTSGDMYRCDFLRDGWIRLHDFDAHHPNWPDNERVWVEGDEPIGGDYRVVIWWGSVYLRPEPEECLGPEALTTT